MAGKNTKDFDDDDLDDDDLDDDDLDDDDLDEEEDLEEDDDDFDEEELWRDIYSESPPEEVKNTADFDPDEFENSLQWTIVICFLGFLFFFAIFVIMQPKEEKKTETTNSYPSSSWGGGRGMTRMELERSQDKAEREREELFRGTQWEE